MLGSCKVVALVATADSARARVFYQDVLGLELVSDDMFAAVFNAGGTMLRVTKVPEAVTAPYTVLGWQVSDIHTVVAGLAAKGVEFQRYAGMAQDDLGIWTTPGGAAKVAWFKDPDGNTLSLTEA